MRAFERYLTEAEQKQLLRTMKLQTGDLLARRDYAWVRALIHSGMRLGEFSRMTVGAALAALRTGWIFIPKEHRKGWNRKPRQRKDGSTYLPKPPKDHTVLVTAPLREALTDLLAVRALQSGCASGHAHDALVISRHGAGLCPRQYELRMARWAALAGLPEGASPHWLRHTRAQNIMRRSTSADPRGIVQAALGHASIASTGIYTAVSREDLAAGLAAVDAPTDRRAVKRGLRAEYRRRASA